MEQENKPDEEIFGEEEEKITQIGWVMFTVLVMLAISLIITLSFTEAYGYALYVGLPTTFGFCYGFLKEPNKNLSTGQVLLYNFAALVILCLMMLLAGLEGGICLIMICAPLYILLVIGFFIGRFVRGNFITRSISSVLILVVNPACVAADFQAVMHSHMVRTNTVIEAPAARVWHTLTHNVDYQPSGNFFFKNGVNYPLSMCLQNRNDSNVLHCILRNEVTDLYITQLVPDSQMRFTLTHHVIPMKELSLYDDVHTPHQDPQFFRLNYGEFRLEAMPGNKCRLWATSDFSYKLAPDFYWTMWSNYLVNKMHTQVLATIKEQTEHH